MTQSSRVLVGAQHLVVDRTAADRRTGRTAPSCRSRAWPLSVSRIALRGEPLVDEERQRRHVERQPLGLAGPVEERLRQRLQLRRPPPWPASDASRPPGSARISASPCSRAGVLPVPVERRRERRVVAVGLRRLLLLELQVRDPASWAWVPMSCRAAPGLAQQERLQPLASLPASATERRLRSVEFDEVDFRSGRSGRRVVFAPGPKASDSKRMRSRSSVEKVPRRAAGRCGQRAALSLARLEHLAVEAE